MTYAGRTARDRGGKSAILKTVLKTRQHYLLTVFLSPLELWKTYHILLIISTISFQLHRFCKRYVDRYNARFLCPLEQFIVLVSWEIWAIIHIWNSGTINDLYMSISSVFRAVFYILNYILCLRCWNIYGQQYIPLHTND